MSRWLKNVNALLENLDNQVEETVEEHNLNRTLSAAARKSVGGDGSEAESGGLGAVEELLKEEAQGVDDILAKRGLLGGDGDEDENEEEGGGNEGIDGMNVEEKVEGGASAVEKEVVSVPKDTAGDEKGESSEGRYSDVVSEVINFDGNESEQKNDLFIEEEKNEDASNAPTKEASPSSADQTQINEENTKSTTTAMLPKQQQQQQAPSSSNLGAPPKSNNNNVATKELRKLRRHVLQLNSDLDAAEREIEAQRAELDRAAGRMERDRSRHKQEKESAETSHKAEVAALVASHDRAMQQLKESHDSAVSEMEERVHRAEQQRAKEGGERDIELANALDRERASLASTAKLQDEKTTMNERITSLMTEVSRLETRLEHATSQMELAAERERNAEEQLDKALSLHARQLSQRQQRESKLEQTVADLGAALVVAKGKIEAGMGGEDFRRANSAPEEDPLDLKARLQDAHDEIETLRAQLQLERQRCSTLHNELQDLSKEQADELSGAHAKQRQYERKISDLTTLVAKLQSSLRRAAGDKALLVGDDATASGEYTGIQHSGDEKKETDHLRKQIMSLSEQQTKMRSEISTLKNRLRSSSLRAETAEKGLEAANQRIQAMLSGMSSTDEEMGLTGRRKKRASSANPARRGFHKSTKVESISSSLGLQPGRFPTGGWREMLSSLLDTFDALAIDLGSHFRHFPVSRLAFMLYLLILHMWAFFLLVYHAHAQGTGGDFHGPEALVRSYRHMEQVPKIAAAAKSMP